MTFIKMSIFSSGLHDSTIRCNAELGDYNQVAVALVIYLLGGKIIGGKTRLASWDDRLRLRV